MWEVFRMMDILLSKMMVCLSENGVYGVYGAKKLNHSVQSLIFQRSEMACTVCTEFLYIPTIRTYIYNPP